MAKKYWLKLHEHYFQEDEILFLSALPNGEKYILFWIRLLLKCLKANDDSNCGFLRLTDKIPYTDELLAKALDTDIDTVRVSMKYFLQLGMVKTLSDGTLYVEEVQKLIGRESESAERVRRHRAKLLQLEDNSKTALQCNINKVTLSPNTNTNTSKEKEEERSAFADDSMPYRMAKLIYELHLNHDEKFLFGKNLEKTFQRWAKDIDKLNRLDGRDAEEIERIIRWCQSPGCFWIGNVLSGATLRKQFPTLIGQSVNVRETADEKRIRLCREEMAKV